MVWGRAKNYFRRKYTSMTIDITYERMPMSQSINEMLVKKLEKLSKKYLGILRADVILKTADRNQRHGRLCRLSIGSPDANMFANANEANFEEATTVAVKQIESQIKNKTSL